MLPWKRQRPDVKDSLPTTPVTAETAKPTPNLTHPAYILHWSLTTSPGVADGYV